MPPSRDACALAAPGAGGIATSTQLAFQEGFGPAMHRDGHRKASVAAGNLRTA